MKKTIAAGVLISLLLLLLSSCTPTPTPMSKTFYEYFNTESSVISYAADTKESFDKIADKVDGMLREYHRLYDIYHDYSGINNLKTVNDKAGREAVEVDGKIIDLLKLGKEMYTLTGGKVNIAMGSVLSLWHDAREGDGEGNHTLPMDSDLSFASIHTDIDSIVIDEAASTVYISDEHTSIDVGAIAKGYATKMIADALMADESLDANGYALNIGGNIRLIGTKADGDWRIGITNPVKSDSDPYVKIVGVSNTSVVTSGDYERFFTVDGKNYHHIIDPETLYPATYHHSVTVIAEDSALADALSTALFTMNINDGHALVESLDGVEALWVRTTGAEPFSTDGFPAVE
ncbi:MAG: FAD:protein FMN transferase [Clostridia bacterium]|nr:FAD:protein FMN transferase [Clostridia bacterium]